MNISNTEVWGFDHAIRSMRHPYESWNKSDSKWKTEYETDGVNGIVNQHEWYEIGNEDLKLAQKLIKCGTEHAKFMRMIHVCADVDMPRYFWSEADTYHFNTKNSCSTMHKLLNNDKPIAKDLFVTCPEDDDVMNIVISRLEELRVKYKSSMDYDEQTRLLVRAKRLLPEGFLQMRMLDTNYAELRNMYFQRRHHRLKEEWADTFCKWIETLPYAKELICFEVNKDA